MLFEFLVLILTVVISIIKTRIQKKCAPQKKRDMLDIADVLKKNYHNYKDISIMNVYKIFMRLN